MEEAKFKKLNSTLNMAKEEIRRLRKRSEDQSKELRAYDRILSAMERVAPRYGMDQCEDTLMKELDICIVQLGIDFNKSQEPTQG